MQLSCIPKSDNIFSKLSEMSTEIKRSLLGKYFTGTDFKTDLSKVIPIYKGERICHKRFNFTLDGGRCFWCNTFSLLTSDGNIISDQPIPIEYGSFRGQRLVISKSEIPNVPFGTYEKHEIRFVSHILNIERMFNMERMINKSCDTSHSIAISSLINSSPVPFKSRILGGWICDEVNTVKMLPTPGNIRNVTFNELLSKDVLFQIYVLSGTDYFNHGSPSANHLFIAAIPNDFDAGGGKKIKLSCILFVDPDRYSSYFTEYNGRKLHFVGKHSTEQIEEPNWNIEYIIGMPSRGSQLTRSPMIKSYSSNRVAIFRPTMNMINYIRTSGINVFPQLNFFLYLTILLTNRSFYNIFINSKMNDILRKICIIDDNNDYEKYITIIRENFDRDLNADQIAELIISSQIRIRYDLLQLISSNIIGMYN